MRLRRSRILATILFFYKHSNPSDSSSKPFYVFYFSCLNEDLKDFIYVKFKSINETVNKAARSYKSTVAVIFLSEVIENALAQRDKKGNVIATMPKPNVKNQARFSKIYVMEFEKADFGKIKLTVGELRGSRQNIQYCISAIENG